VAPLAVLEVWSRSAGSSYAWRLAHHENLQFAQIGSPYGLWLRELFELDPLLQVGFLVAVIYTFRSRTFRRVQSVLLGAGYAVGLALVAASATHAPPRVGVSLTLFALLAAVVWRTGILERRSGNPPATRDGVGVAVGAPFDPRALMVAVLVVCVLFTAWREVSNMPRLVFPAWPILVLGLIGLLLRLLPEAVPSIVTGTAVLGSLLFTTGAVATYEAKSAASRADVYAAHHPELRRLRYEDLWNTRRAGAVLSRRTRYDVTVIGPAATLYPASCYEEEPYKIELFRQMLRDFDLEGVLSAEGIQWAFVFFADSPPIDSPAVNQPAEATR